MAFKTAKEIEARKAFIAGADKGEIKQESIWSFVDLTKLNPDELIDRLERIDNQGNLMKWHILWVLRQKFASDKLFGQYITDVRATRPNWLSSARDVSRAVAAGRFCEKHSISDLNDIGISQSCIYALSSPINEDVADKIFSKIKNKNVSHKDVERIIAQTKAVATIEHQAQQPVEVDYELETIEFSDNSEIVVNQLAMNENASATIIQQVTDNQKHGDSSVHHRRLVLLQELAAMDASHLTVAQRVDEILMLAESYRELFIKLIPTFQGAIKRLQMKSYNKD